MNGVNKINIGVPYGQILWKHAVAEQRFTEYEETYSVNIAPMFHGQSSFNKKKQKNND